MLRSLAAISLVVCLGAQAARAQDLEAICRQVGHPPVGAWSEFRIDGGENNGATVRMSIVGSESRGGTRYLWMEVAAHGFSMGREQGGPTAPLVINKMLVAGVGPDMGTPQAVIMKFGDAPAMEMPAGRTRATETPGTTALARCRQGKAVGWESVTVPAGTFRALHVRDAHNRGDLWVVPSLPFAVVKETDLGGGANDMVLIGHGRGATTRIREKPQPWNPQLFMQMMMRPGGRGH
jgi:hypothetical protein